MKIAWIAFGLIACAACSEEQAATEGAAATTGSSGGASAGGAGGAHAGGSGGSGGGGGAPVSTWTVVSTDACCVVPTIHVDETAVYVAGRQMNGSAEQLRIEKRSKEDGSLIAEFGTGGVVLIDVGSTDGGLVRLVGDATALYVRSDSYLRRIDRVTGTELGQRDGCSASPCSSDAALDATGLYQVFNVGNLWPLDKTSLDLTMIVYTAPQPTQDPTDYGGPSALEVSGGTLVVVGGWLASNGIDDFVRIVGRSAATGGVVWADNDIDFGNLESLSALAIAGSDVFAVGTWLEKRSLATGEPSQSFGQLSSVLGYGQVQPPDNSYWYDVAVAGTTVYAFGRHRRTGSMDSYFQVQAFSTSDGSSVQTFGVDGVFDDPTPIGEVSRGFATDGTALYGVASRPLITRDEWVIAKWRRE